AGGRSAAAMRTILKTARAAATSWSRVAFRGFRLPRFPCETSSSCPLRVRFVVEKSALALLHHEARRSGHKARDVLPALPLRQQRWRKDIEAKRRRAPTRSSASPSA